MQGFPVAFGVLLGLQVSAGKGSRAVVRGDEVAEIGEQRAAL